MKKVIFRGKSTLDDKWVYGDLITKGPEDRIYISDEYQRLISIYSESVGQFIGVTDLKGTQVFEGDLFLPSPEWNEEAAPVVFDDNEGTWCVGKYPVIEFLIINPSYSISKKMRVMDGEVVGNSFESVKSKYRKIKFRGVDKCTNKWISGDCLHIDSENIVIVKDYRGNRGAIYRDSLGQATDFVDLNGKEIYEGDFIRILDDNNPDKSSILEVKFINGRFGLGKALLDLDFYCYCDNVIKGNIVGDTYFGMDKEEN